MYTIHVSSGIVFYLILYKEFNVGLIFCVSLQKMVLFDPPIPEFSLGHVTLVGPQQYHVVPMAGPSLVLVYEGNGLVEGLDIALAKVQVEWLLGSVFDVSRFLLLLLFLSFFLHMLV